MLKNSLFTLSMLLFFVCNVCTAQQHLKPATSDYLRRSSGIIRETQKILVRLDSTSKTGKYALSIHHQRYAVERFRAEDYKGAIFHSYRARELAIAVYLTKNKQLTPKFKYLPNERELTDAFYPGDAAMDDKLKKAQPYLRMQDDEFMKDAKLHKLDADDISNY